MCNGVDAKGIFRDDVGAFREHYTRVNGRGKGMEVNGRYYEMD